MAADSLLALKTGRAAFATAVAIAEHLSTLCWSSGAAQATGNPMEVETLGWFGTIWIFGLGALTTALGLALLFARDTQGKRTISVGIGVLSFGVFCLLWSTGLLQRMSPDRTLLMVSVTLGLFALSVLWNLRGMPRGYPAMSKIESALEGSDIADALRPPTSPLNAAASGRLGLVLEGGGAKGAYAFGCIKAFSEAGLRFDAIAGSSVGGLNAALLASNQLEFGSEYWGSVTHRKVYHPNPLAPLLLPVLLLRALLYGLSEATGIKEASPKAIVPTLIAGGVLSMAGALALWGVGRVVGWQGAPSLNDAIIILALAVAVAVLVSIPLLIDTFALSLLIPDALRQQVQRIASHIDTSAARVYVTHSERVSLVDPDYITGYRQTTLGDRPLEEVVRVPVYTALNDLEPVERVQAIMASAALPVGIFPPVIVNGRRYSDGGEVDNVPVLPLISLFPCDTLVVVRLRPNPNPSPIAQYAAYIIHSSLCDRTIRLRSLPTFTASEMAAREYGGDFEKAGTIKFPPILFPLRELDFRPRTIITIAPAKDLGGFLRGTLNFRGKKAREWMEEGYRDARERISEIQSICHASEVFP
jgi:hypothetical protein